jgi:hypothetical protein
LTFRNDRRHEGRRDRWRRFDRSSGRRRHRYRCCDRCGDGLCNRNCLLGPHLVAVVGIIGVVGCCDAGVRAASGIASRTAATAATTAPAAALFAAFVGPRFGCGGGRCADISGHRAFDGGCSCRDDRRSLIGRGGHDGCRSRRYRGGSDVQRLVCRLRRTVSCGPIATAIAATLAALARLAGLTWLARFARFPRFAARGVAICRTCSLDRTLLRTAAVFVALFVALLAPLFITLFVAPPIAAALAAAATAVTTIIALAAPRPLATGLRVTRLSRRCSCRSSCGRWRRCAAEEGHDSAPERR